MAVTTGKDLRALPALNMAQRGVYAAVTVNVAFPLGPALGLNIATAGLYTITGLGDNDTQVYLTQGWNPCPCKKVVSGASTSGIVAVY